MKPMADCCIEVYDEDMVYSFFTVEVGDSARLYDENFNKLLRALLDDCP